MTRERMDVLFHNALGWVCEHTYDMGEYEYKDYARALHNIGFTMMEAFEELSKTCGVADDDAKAIVMDTFDDPYLEQDFVNIYDDPTLGRRIEIYGYYYTAEDYEHPYRFCSFRSLNLPLQDYIETADLSDAIATSRGIGSDIEDLSFEVYAKMEKYPLIKRSEIKMDTPSGHYTIIEGFGIN